MSGAVPGKYSRNAASPLPLPASGRAIAFETRGLIPPPCGEGGWPKASRVGVTTAETVLGATPTPASATGDATHRLRSADPPHKGEGSNLVAARVTKAAADAWEFRHM